MASDPEVVFVSETGAPVQAGSESNPSADTSVALLVDMGFLANVAQRALQIKEFNMDQALNLLLEKGPAFVMNVEVPAGDSAPLAPVAFGSGASSSTDVPQRDSDGSSSKDLLIPKNATMQDLEDLKEQALKDENYEGAATIRDHIKKMKERNDVASDAKLLADLEHQKEEAVKAEEYEQAAQFRDQIRNLKLKMHTAKPAVPPTSILGKRERPALSSPFSFAKFSKKQKQNDLPDNPPAAPAFGDSATASSSNDVPPQKKENLQMDPPAAGPANQSSGASSSTDVPPQPKVQIKQSVEGGGSAGSKDVPPKQDDASASSGLKEVPQAQPANNVAEQQPNAPEVVAPESTDSSFKDPKGDAPELAAESTKASSADAADKSSKSSVQKKKSKESKPTEMSKKWLISQRQAIAEVSTEQRKLPTDLRAVPHHASISRIQHGRPCSKPNLKCIWDDQGQLKQIPNVEILLEVTMELNQEVCKKGLEYWWHQGRGPYITHRGIEGDYKWKSRFDHLCDRDEQSEELGGPYHVGSVYNVWNVHTEVEGVKHPLCITSHDQYFLQSLRNMQNLKPKVVDFLRSIGQAKEFWNDNINDHANENRDPDLFWGVIDERAISSLALPIVLMQDPKTFGVALHQKVPHVFDKWFPVGEDILKKSQEMASERDMLLCRDLANVSEEVVKGQFASHWFRDGSIADQPFLFQKGRQGFQMFCEKCGQWVSDRRSHLQSCLSHWSCPHSLSFPFYDSHKDYQTIRMFQQTLGFDLGVTIQFKYVDKDNVQVKICAEFEPLLRRMLYMDYWPNDGVSARWRLLKNQSYAEDNVTTTHRSKSKTMNFTMRNSLDMPRAVSPNCLVHKLKGEQPHTLSWMYSREGRSYDGHISEAFNPSAFKCKQIISRRIAGSDVKVELELERSYDRIRGGILGDQVGYGKTACMIALIAQTQLNDPQEPVVSDWEKPYAKEYIFTKATLIVTPPNLFDQWSGEFKKFVDVTKCNLKILTICNHTYMKRYKMKDFVDADVVLVSFRFFFSEAYRKYFDADVGSVKTEAGYLSTRIIKCRHRIFNFLKQNRLNELLEKRALFEAFYWKRVVFDEFHEVVQVDADTPSTKISYCFMRQLHSRFHWGLTATPLLGSFDGIRKMASLLHIFLPKQLDGKHAQFFVDEYFRANKWNTGDVLLEEKWMKVCHCPEERALYLNQERNMVGKDGINKLNTEASQRLLQFCSHFCPDGHAQSVGNAIQKVRKDNSDQQEHLRKQIKTAETNLGKLRAKGNVVSKFQKFVSKARSLYVGIPGCDGVAAFVHTPIEQLVVLFADWMEGQMVSPAEYNKLQSLNQTGRGKCGNHYCNFCSALRNNGGVSSQSFEAMIRVAERVPLDLDKKLKELEAAVRYLNHAIKSVTEIKEGEERPECSLCMEEMQPEDTVITKCGHAYHESCIRDVLNNHPLCPLCRASTTMQQCTNVRELALSVKKTSDTDPKRAELRKKVGSKILAIVDLIKSIKKSEKVLIFIQWNAIRDSLSKAIESATTFKPHLLEGDTQKRNKVLKAFQQGTGLQDQVMMLSIEQSATGVNLVCANHCILVHPMFGSHKHATDCEKQAIGRIRRQGQQRKCFVYRFYTEGTIEERLMKEHSKELKDLPMPEEEDQETDKVNIFKEPPVRARPIDAHELVFDEARKCASCNGCMDFCKVGSVELTRLNDNRRRVHGAIAKNWVCDKCGKEFDSQASSRYACIDKPECDYDLCESCYKPPKKVEVRDFARIADIRAKYCFEGSLIAIGFDSGNVLVFQKSGRPETIKLKPVQIGQVCPVQTYEQPATTHRHYSGVTMTWRAVVNHDVFERRQPPEVLHWSARFFRWEQWNDAHEVWKLVPENKDNVPDPNLNLPFNIPDPKVRKARAKLNVQNQPEQNEA